MKHLSIILLALVIVSCTTSWKPGDNINNGHDFLCNAGICDDSLNVADDVNYNDDGKDLPHHILDLKACQTLGLDKVMGIDTVSSIVRVWGMRDYSERGITLLLGQTSYSDTRTCWLATYGKDGMIDFMRLGECGGMNLSYWDDLDEHTRHVGFDSMHMVMPDKFGKPINVSRWISFNEQRDGVDTDSTLWFIHNEVPIIIGNDGLFSLGKVGTVYSSDTTLLTNYWRNKRALEVLNWTPLSDKSFCDKVNIFLDEAQGTITEPAQLLGDFHVLMSNRLYCDTQAVMQWCCDHPESQLSRGLVKTMKDINPEYLLDEFKKIKDPKVAARARQLLGL